MATKRVLRRRGDSSEHSTFTGAVAEITVNTQTNQVVVHDGATVGGFPAALETDIPASVAELDDVALPNILAAGNCLFGAQPIGKLKTQRSQLDEVKEIKRPNFENKFRVARNNRLGAVDRVNPL